MGFVIETGKAAIVRDTARLVQDAKVSQARIVNSDVPLPLGVPCRLQFVSKVQDVLDRVNPVGCVPTGMLQVYGPVPPTAANRKE